MDRIKEKIINQINIRNNIWNALMLSIGGTLTLLFNINNNLIRNIFLVFGVLLTLFFLFAYFKNNDCIENLINKLKEEIQ